MKEIFLQFSAYNIWANQLLLDAIGQLPEEKQLQTVPSSFDSLMKTVVHLWDAEAIWWQRLKLSEKMTIGRGEDTANRFYCVEPKEIICYSIGRLCNFKNESLSQYPR